MEHLVFPKVWRNERNTESDFHAFLTRYNGYLSSRGDICLKCSCNLPGGGRMLQMDRRYQYGTQNFTCYDCMNQYCDDCRVDESAYYIEGFCSKCERIYCADCKTVKYCHCCENDICVDCIDFKQCSQCDERACLECARGCHNACGADNIWCNGCVELGNGGLSWCHNCDEVYCRDCCESDVYAAEYCNFCQDSLCGQCRVNKKEWNRCERCDQLTFPVLMEDREKMQTQINELQTQINELENERR